MRKQDLNGTSLFCYTANVRLKSGCCFWWWKQGPTFGAMMISGQKAAHLALKALGLPNALDGNYVGSVQPELILAAADAASEIVDA